jgi:hypothetical protein
LFIRFVALQTIYLPEKNGVYSASVAFRKAGKPKLKLLETGLQRIFFTSNDPISINKHP